MTDVISLFTSYGPEMNKKEGKSLMGMGGRNRTSTFANIFTSFAEIQGF